MRSASGKLTIKSMLLIPMLAVNLMIVAIFFVALNASRVNARVREAEVATLYRATVARGEQVEQRFNNLAQIAANMALDMQASVELALGRADGLNGALQEEPHLAAAVLDSCLSDLVNTLRLNEATGAFVLLNVSAGEPGSGGFGGSQVSGLYVNDLDLTASNARNTDLVLVCGPGQSLRGTGLRPDDNWTEEMRLDRLQGSGVSELFGAVSADSAAYTGALGHWSRPVSRADGTEAFLYLLPLRDYSGVPYGIAGVEVTVDYLTSRLEPSELGYGEDGFYAVTRFADGGPSPDLLMSAGRSVTGAGFVREALADYGENIYRLQGDNGTSSVVAAYPMRLQGTGRVLEQPEWGLMAGAASDVLFADADNLQNLFLVAFVAALAVGIVFSIFGSNIIVRPITRLARQLQAADPDVEIELPRTRIQEVDMLIDSIEELSGDLMETAHRTTQAIEMTEMAIGFLEINPVMERVYLTDYLFGLFGLQKEGESNFIPLDLWNEMYDRLMENEEPGLENIYLMDFVEQQPFRWLRIKTALSAERTFGIIIDATDEILEKKQLEFERDTDPLTGLLNRQAFFAQAEEKLQELPGKAGVMLFADLDNLKYVNDTYGHDFGDRYIKAAANVFGQYTQHGGIVSRISGDEFAIFLYGADTKDALARVVSETYASMDSVTILLPDGMEIPIRCSIGFSWYPDDSGNLEQLLKYADFAMYETKRSVKGSIREFNIDSYLKNSYLVEKNEEFNQFIEQNQVSYAFQPIVDIYSGAVFAYEALMRPETPEFETPFQVLQIARSQAKLYQIERMTVFNILEWLDNNLVEMYDQKLFLNSIPNQMLSQRDLAELELRYGHLMSRLVVEITEDERSDAESLIEKIDVIRRMGPAIAVDDFGAGYSNEVIVLNSNPNYIKIDMSLVSDISNDHNKQKLVENIIGYAHPLGIKIIAEGIESREEAEMMIQLGADYLQGFYLGRPERRATEIPDEISEFIRETAARYRDRRSNR